MAFWFLLDDDVAGVNENFSIEQIYNDLVIKNEEVINRLKDTYTEQQMEFNDKIFCHES